MNNIFEKLKMDNLFEILQKSILEYDGEAAERWSQQTIRQGIDPLKSFEAVVDAIRIVGEDFNKGDLFLPELVGAAEAMSRAMALLEDEIKRSGKKRNAVGKVVMGTVFGDIHNMGKTMVCALLRASDFEVIDLGVNVTVEEFIEAVRLHKPHILAMSTLLTTSAPEQRKVIEGLKKFGLRDEVMVAVGGGAITNNFAKKIGADGYAPTAPLAVDLARELINEARG